jgi:2-polyprenyl-6-methoxyphenol hydroxylase-like FAD-dependent oxidoreductase
MSDRADVAIAGGGPVGAALALALAKAGYEVALIEPQSAPVLIADEAYDLRTYALSAASIALLTRLGAWTAVASMRAEPYVAMRVWEDAPERALSFDARLIGERVLGAIVEDRVLRAALFERIEREPRI